MGILDMTSFGDFKPIFSKNACGISYSEVRITKRCLKFNREASCEMHYASHVMFLISQDAKKMVIIACDENNPNAAPFFKTAEELEKEMAESGQRKRAPQTVSYTDASIVGGIREKLGWRDNLTRVCSGVRYKEECALLFNLETAEVTKGRKSRKKRVGNYLDSLPSLSELTHDMRPMPILALPGPSSSEGEMEHGFAVLNREEAGVFAG